ncbi:MAG: F-type H+-transporting ATPase subunit epsilon [Flavobacteriales bacterium]|jgi:F-type H+-transporting ATPase subunit epsilon
MKVEIITPDANIFAGEATALQVPGTDGLLGILNGHAPLVSTLAKGKVKVTAENGEDKFFDINGGVVEVLNNKVMILAE